jgi:ubiquinone/menaquinone biosynthesis C-methylase UbiE
MDFNAEALNWDNERRAKRAKIIAEEISKTVQIESHYNALEFGCGTGLVSFNLYNKFESITLFDTSKGMIDVLNQKIQNSCVKNMTALYSDINKETPMIGKFDVIYTSMALHHIKDTETTLRNLFTLLKNGGHLCIVELTEDDGTFHKLEEGFDGHNGFNQIYLKGLLGDVGFHDVASNVFYNGEKIIDGQNVKYSLFLMVGEKYS